MMGKMREKYPKIRPGIEKNILFICQNLKKQNFSWWGAFKLPFYYISNFYFTIQSKTDD